jgi:hypothetical protein
MDNDYPIDIGEILSVLRTGEVIVVRFLILSLRLLVDSRSSAKDGPLIRLVPAASSAEERFRSLRKLRPDFPAPERITVIHWPKRVDQLIASGVWSGLEERLRSSGFAGTTEAVASTLVELQRLERTEIRRAILGEGYQTLWERQ